MSETFTREQVEKICETRVISALKDTIPKREHENVVDKMRREYSKMIQKADTYTRELTRHLRTLVTLQREHSFERDSQILRVNIEIPDMAFMEVRQDQMMMFADHIAAELAAKVRKELSDATSRGIHKPSPEDTFRTIRSRVPDQHGILRGPTVSASVFDDQISSPPVYPSDAVGHVLPDGSARHPVKSKPPNIKDEIFDAFKMFEGFFSGEKEDS